MLTWRNRKEEKKSNSQNRIYTHIRLLSKTLSKWHYLLHIWHNWQGIPALHGGTIFSASSHRPAQECSQTGTWTESGYNPPAGRQGAKQLDVCPGYKLHPCREPVYSSHCCFFASQATATAARASPLQSATTETHGWLQGLLYEQMKLLQPTCVLCCITHTRESPYTL